MGIVLPNNSGDHNANVVECAGFKMPTGAAAGYAMVCQDALGNGAWQKLWSWDTEHTADADTIALYHMEDAAGGAVDSSGNGYNLAEYGAGNAITYAQGGKFGNDMLFNGGVGLGSTTAAFMTALRAAWDDKLTYEVWSKPAVTTADKFLVTFGNAGSSPQCRIATAAANIMRWHNQPADVSNFTGGATDTTQFKHYAVTVNQAANEVKGYENNVLIGTKNPAASANAVTRFSVANFCIDAGYKFSGHLDEVAVSKIVRY